MASMIRKDFEIPIEVILGRNSNTYHVPDNLTMKQFTEMVAIDNNISPDMLTLSIGGQPICCKDKVDAHYGATFRGIIAPVHGCCMYHSDLKAKNLQAQAQLASLSEEESKSLQTIINWVKSAKHLTNLIDDYKLRLLNLLRSFDGNVQHLITHFKILESRGLSLL